MFPALKSWDATSLPSTGSDHVPIVIMLASPLQAPLAPRPKWDETDWLSLEAPLRSFVVPPPPTNPSPPQLDHWFSSSLKVLTSLIRSVTPTSKPFPHSKPWWTPLLTALRKEYSKATRVAKKSHATSDLQMARLSRNGYFKPIKRAKATYSSSFLAKTTPQNIWTAKKFVSPRKTPRFPSLPEAYSPVAINQALLNHFFPPRPAPPGRGRLASHPSHEPLTKEEIAQALSKSSQSSAPGPDKVPYLVWKKVNHYNQDILLALLAPRVEVWYHPPSLKHPNGVVLDKPAKPSYDSPSSFHIIVLLKTISKILERVLTIRLMSFAKNASLLHPNQCGSLPGLSATDAVATLSHEVRTLQRPRRKVSTLFLDIKAGFDNVDAIRLRAILLQHKAPAYMVDWVSSFLSERSCTLFFLESPNTPATISVGTPQGSPISPLLFLIYLSPLDLKIPKGLMISYVDDFSVTVASESHRTNIRRLQGIFRTLSRKGRTLNVEFSIPKTELIHWRSPSQRPSPPSRAPITLGGLVFHPAQVVRWLGFWLTPPLNSQQHFSRRLALARASFSFVKRLSSPGAGIHPFLAHRITQGPLLPIATYGADFLIPNTRSLTALNSFSHSVCPWVTNNFYSTPTLILLREACLAPMDSYCK